MALGMYIHVPFCLAKCSYCDFVSCRWEQDKVSAYLKALAKEAGMRSKELSGGNKQVESLYIGGGTPTCLKGEEILFVIEKCSFHFDLLPGAEITLEANPGTISMEKLEFFYRNGVNRLSIGAQACQEQLLMLLGRKHSFEDVQDAVRSARKAGFKNISIDLIFGIPGQTTDDWNESLQRVIELSPEHISAYGLHLAAGTPLNERINKGKLEVLEEEIWLAMYEEAIEVLTAAGFEHYEISNFALPGRQCRHNLLYWHNLPYLGLGPAAYSYLNNRRFGNEKSLEKYIQKINEGKLAEAESEALPQSIRMAETVILGLRLLKGIDLNEFALRFGKRLEEVYPKQIDKLIRFKLIEHEGEKIRLTRRGLAVSNQVFVEFV
ncbi:MAG TPA: coproporphyrinogen III oxidase [Desulfotomaculum sp.]|nr:MAG: Oxygen-independent coproporphyrinogen III oxidase [Desulfotomaculum sp. 46_80]KUK85407.1 MAG: Oxygen-independent coproporphyrinogen III oxidase [Desulfofundulus kuznetsovii]HAG09986.1 coproporphyrinogen III oxidase [Desulfotomaculum sp.]HBY03372.1 coproporphyrinogen III oxidase [Desulfotomaculum sp.]